MKRLLLVMVAMIIATAQPVRAGDFWRESGQACVFGAAVLGASAVMMLYPALANAPTTLPATTLVIGNSLFGCGLGVLGSVASFSFTAVYDRLFGPSVSPDTDSKPPLSTNPSRAQGSVT